MGLVCNDEGKLIGLELNRGLRDEDGNLYDIMAGTFLVVGLGEEDFTSLPPELAQKYMEHFKQPEQFINLNGQIIALPVEPENPLRTAEMTVEDDYGMIDGVINNGRKGEELEAAKYLARSAKDGRLDPFWLLTGSDAFLAVEAGDAIRAEARRQGYTDRQVLDMNASADWSRLPMAAADIGMFDDRKIVDVRLSTGNPGKNGAPAIVKYLDNPIDGVVTLITMPAPDWTVTKEAWWGALQRKATVVDCSPVERAQLPSWLKARLARHELVMSPETLDYFADMMEGNLFAAAQEIEKLSLLHPKGEITSEQLRQAVSSNARFDFDTLFESMRLGQADRIVRIIDGLEAQAEALPFLLAMLTAEIRSLIKLRTGYDNGQSRVTGVFATPSLQKAARRLTVKKLCGALSVCADIDRLVKGLPVPKRDSDPWIELKSVVLFLAS